MATKRQVFRRADTGRFTSKAYATKHPKTTIRQLIPIGIATTTTKSKTKSKAKKRR